MPSGSQTRNPTPPARLSAPTRSFPALHPAHPGDRATGEFPDTVSRFIDQFTSEHPTLDRRQLQFLGLLRDFLIDRSTVEKRDLIQAPFTLLHPSRIRGIFSPTEINELLALTHNLVT